MSVSKKIYNVLAIIIMFYPILIMVEPFIPYCSTILTASFLFGYGICAICQKKSNVIKYLCIGIILFLGYKFNTNEEIFFQHIISLSIMFFSLDLSEKNEMVNYIITTIRNNKKNICFFIMLNICINVIMIFIDSGYASGYSESWQLNAYKGIYDDPHQCAYRMCTVLILILAINDWKSKKYGLIAMIILALTLITGARVPTILAIALTIIIFKNYKFKIFLKAKNEKEYNIGVISLMIIMMIILITIVIIIGKSSFGKKMIVSISNNSFDNGRADFVRVGLDYFKESNWINKLLGNGSERTYLINQEKIYAYVWSHNDFIQILIGQGILIVGIYIIKWLKILKLSKTKILIMILIGVAWFNGMYIHPRVSCMIPILVNVLSKTRRKKDEKYSNYNNDIKYRRS